VTDRSHHAGAGAGRGRTGPPGYPPAADSCTQDLRFAMGSYALGALDPAEADIARLHLVECAACRAEYREMAAVPAVLARITEAEMSAPAAMPTDDMLARLLGEAAIRDPSAFAPSHAAGGAAASRLGFSPVPDETDPTAATLSTQAPRRSRRRAAVRHSQGFLATLWAGSAFRRVGLAAAGGALAAVAVIGVYAVTSGSHQPSVYSNSIEAENPAMKITGSLQYHATEWGSSVQVTMHNVPPGDDCMLLAVDSKGNRVVASTWWAPSSGSATIDGGVAMEADEITKFDVVTATGQTLLELPVKGATSASTTTK
jgi:hypothetical protein